MTDLSTAYPIAFSELPTSDDIDGEVRVETGVSILHSAVYLRDFCFVMQKIILLII